jgi:hypothetical protein
MMSVEQMNAIGRLSAFYGRYPGLRTVWAEYQDGSVHFQASYLVPVDESDTEGTFPERQCHWIAADGSELVPVY